VFVFPTRPSDIEVLALAERWVQELSVGGAEAAMALLDTSDTPEWTPQHVSSIVAGYGAPVQLGRSTSRVTSPRSAAVAGLQPRHSVHWFPPHPGRDARLEASVSYDLPINGSWSDLTALFWVKRVPAGYALELEDIHVL
jgi:hypothetical protein